MTASSLTLLLMLLLAADTESHDNHSDNYARISYLSAVIE